MKAWFILDQFNVFFNSTCVYVLSSMSFCLLPMMSFYASHKMFKHLDFVCTSACLELPLSLSFVFWYLFMLLKFNPFVNMSLLPWVYTILFHAPHSFCLCLCVHVISFYASHKIFTGRVSRDTASQWGGLSYWDAQDPHCQVITFLPFQFSTRW